MQGTTDMKIRVASPNTGEQLRFVVDGVAGPTISVPNTGGWQNWQTIDAGTFQFKPGTYHAVQIQQVTGGYNLNWWQATRTDNPETVVDDSQLTYDANWHASSDRGLGDYDDDVHHSETVGAAASYTFTGTGIDYLSERNGDMGNVDVYLDNVLQANVNLKVSGARQSQQVVWSKTGLTSGTHTLRIVNKTGAVGMIDALRVHS
jgi:hypothetical protein